MTRLFWTLRTLAGHWLRHPVNLAALVAGLAIATALWSGVAALNAQARASYARAAAVFSGGGARSVTPARGALFSQELYVRLRRAGVKVSPALEGKVRIGARGFRLVGIEPLTLPRATQLGRASERRDFGGFIGEPGETLVAPQTLAELGLSEGDAAALANGRRLPPLVASAEAPAGALIVDIAHAQELLEKPDQLSRLLVAGDAEIDAAALARLAGDALRLAPREETPELEGLTRAFHLNLTAFGFLAFLVGLFIVYASFGLGFEQRLPMIRTMRAVGVSLRALVAATLIELFVFGLVCGVAGDLLGYVIASALLPNVAASLDSLYDAQVSTRLTLDVSWTLGGLAMSMLGAFAAAATGLVKTIRLPILDAARPEAWHAAQLRLVGLQGGVAAFALATALAALLFGESLEAGFVAIAGALLGVALALPGLLAVALSLAGRAARSPLAQWFWAEGRQQLGSLSLALMALLIALATNVGVGAMVEGFRQTFVAWLDERLVADVYLDASTTEDARRIAAWLETRPEVAAILPVWKTQIRLSGWPVEVQGMKSDPLYRAHFPLLAATGNPFDALARGDSALVSEQLARRLKLNAGDALELPTPAGDWRVTVVGIYPDYGNPKGQLRVGLDALDARWPQAQRTSISVTAAPGAAEKLMDDLLKAFGPQIARLADQAEVKEFSLAVFERTFAVTAALDSLTLFVSGVALLATLMTLGAARTAQVAPLWAIGLSRRRIAALEFARILFFALATALVALPLGVLMAWLLVAVVNVQAFGWRLPLHLFPMQWAQVTALALLTAGLSGLAPIARLARTSPAELLKVFANER